jgi:hypothetical protein
MIRPSMLLVGFGSLIFLWHECGEDLPVFCYRIGLGAVTGLRRRGLVLVPTRLAVHFAAARNRTECLRPSVTSSTRFSTLTD